MPPGPHGTFGGRESCALLFARPQATDGANQDIVLIAARDGSRAAWCGRQAAPRTWPVHLRFLSRPCPFVQAMQMTSNPSGGWRPSWLLLLVLAAVVSSLAAAGAWVCTTPEYVAFALLRVYNREPKLVFTTTENDAQDFEIYKRTQKGLMSSRFVLSAALRSPDVERLPAVRQKGDAVTWLEERIQVEFPGEAEAHEGLVQPLRRRLRRDDHQRGHPGLHARSGRRRAPAADGSAQQPGKSVQRCRTKNAQPSKPT